MKTDRKKSMDEYFAGVMKPLEKKGTKFTVLHINSNTREELVSKGYVDSTNMGRVLAYSKPKGRKMQAILSILRGEVILLKGHHKDRHLFECEVPFRHGYTSVTCDGTPCFVNREGDNGSDELMEFLKAHLVTHTVLPRSTFHCLTEYPDEHGDRAEVDPEFRDKLLAVLGHPVYRGEPSPPPPSRKTLFTPAMIKQLQARDGKDPEYPLYKLFMPEGAGAWVVFSLGPEGDRLWAACDLGEGYVEYGTVSLADLETMRGKMLGLHVERDRHFDPKRYSLSQLLELPTLSGI